MNNYSVIYDKVQNLTKLYQTIINRFVFTDFHQRILSQDLGAFACCECFHRGRMLLNRKSSERHLHLEFSTFDMSTLYDRIIKLLTHEQIAFGDRSIRSRNNHDFCSKIVSTYPSLCS